MPEKIEKAVSTAVEALLGRCKPVYVREVLKKPPRRYVQSCFSTSEDRESSFHSCGGPVMLVQTCLCAGET